MGGAHPMGILDGPIGCPSLVGGLRLYGWIPISMGRPCQCVRMGGAHSTRLLGRSIYPTCLEDPIGFLGLADASAVPRIPRTGRPLGAPWGPLGSLGRADLLARLGFIGSLGRAPVHPMALLGRPICCSCTRNLGRTATPSGLPWTGRRLRTHSRTPLGLGINCP